MKNAAAEWEEVLWMVSEILVVDWGTEEIFDFGIFGDDWIDADMCHSFVKLNVWTIGFRVFANFRPVAFCG